MRGNRICYLIVLFLLGALVGCGKTADTHTQGGGTLYFNAGAVVEITYDEYGIVVSVTPGTDNAKEIVEAYTDYADKSCSQVVEELLAQMESTGYFEEEKDIRITFAENSGLPEEDFVRDIEATVQEIIKEKELDVTITVEAPKPSVSDTTTQGSETESEESSIPEGAVEQEDGTYLLVKYKDVNDRFLDSEEDAYYSISYVYSADGILISEDIIRIKTKTCSTHIEYFENGNRKLFQWWNPEGILIREIVAFNDVDERNCITTEYDITTGKMTSRITEGNPDGSNATWEMWYEENSGEYYTLSYDSPYLITIGENGEECEATVVAESCVRNDGSSFTNTYDYKNGTVHHVGTEPSTNSKSDTINKISSFDVIEGYRESEMDGIYSRTEWKDGHKVIQIVDGTYYFSYKVKDTTYYHSNGQVKSFERYFYIDGGHYYAEFDEAGNETFLEITTAYY